MKSKKEKIITYLLSGLIPVVIFIIAMILNKCYPFGDKLLNIYDSKNQYSSILLTAVRGIKSGNLFYTMNAGLGLNLYGMTTYYTTGILNIFALFANETNYDIYSTIMILVRFMCLGLSMCFYLQKKNLKPIYTIILSVSYALMGFTSTYYYNFIWIDSIILLPLVIYGLEKLIKENKPLFYIITLSLAIISNFYIGYMICIFCTLFFFYKLYLTKSENKKEIIKTFIISSILSGLISCAILIPAFFALIDGKTVIYSFDKEYFSFNKNILTTLYSLTPGSYKHGDQIDGQALIYSSLFVFVNSILYFFNKGISKKEKKASFLIILIFLISILFNPINYIWHMFAKPIWYPFRFSFLVSFFLIYISSNNLIKIDKLKMSKNFKILLSAAIIILIELSAMYKLNLNLKENINNTYLGYILGFTFITIIIYISSINKDSNKKKVLFISLIFIDLFINAAYTLYENNKNAINFKQDYKMMNEYKNQIKIIKKNNNKDYYRIDVDNYYIINMGLTYGYNSIDAMSSIRSNDINKFLKNTGLYENSEFARVEFDSYDPAVISLYNIKYIVNKNGNDYRTINNILPLGFTTNKGIKDIKLNKDVNYAKNIEKIYSSFLNEDTSFYKYITYKDFKTYSKDGNIYSEYSFTANKDYVVRTDTIAYTVFINNKKYTDNDFNEIFNVKKGDKIKLRYVYNESISTKQINLTILDLEKFNKSLDELDKKTSKLSNIKINQNHHIISGEIDVNKKNTYLFTTIGYHKGMKVYVDGKRIKPDIIDNAVIGLDLTKGHHKIVIDYIPQGFILGIIASIIGIICTILLIRYRKKVD